jgi:uncharacterized protein involved in exopolysaccharide biosynthesis
VVSVSEKHDDLDFRLVLEKLQQNWRTMVLCIALAVVAGVVFMHTTTPKYQAEMRVTASGSPGSDPSRRLGGLGGLAALAGVGLDTSGGATPFQLYLDALKSRELAEQLSSDQRIMTTVFADEWNAQNRTWVRPHGFASDAMRSLKQLAGGSTQWRTPDASRLQEYLNDKIDVVVPGPKDAPITEISYLHKDPAFSGYLLTRLNRLADSIVRRKAQERAASYVDYLSQRLETTIVPEHRKAISDALLTQEQSLMMASSALPFSASIVEDPIVTPRPAWPKLSQVLISFLLAGGMLGAAFALFDVRLLPRRPRAKPSA